MLDIYQHPELVLFLILGLAGLAALWGAVLRILATVTFVVVVLLLIGIGLLQLLAAIGRV